MKRMPNGDIYLPGMGRLKRIDPNKTAEESSSISEEKERQQNLWTELQKLRVDEGLEAYRLGDSLGAAWEGQRPGWQQTSYEKIMDRSGMYPRGTDESDTVDCFLAFDANYEFDGNLEALLVNWARWHAQHHGATRYGNTWKDYFRTVKSLDKSGQLTSERLRQIALDRNHGGSAGNGCLALALPVYAYAKKINLRPTPWDGWVYKGTFGNGKSCKPVDRVGWVTTRTELVEAFVALSHASPEALASVRFICFLFDLVHRVHERNVCIDSKVSDCDDLVFYYDQTDEPAWQLSPTEFCSLFPQNVLCGGALVHALYALHTAADEKDLICRVVSMRGDVDSVLALALMLWRLFFPVSKNEVAYANQLYEPDEAWIGRMPESHWRSYYI